MGSPGGISWGIGADLRDWQTEALDAWRDAGDRGVAAVVTGGGKTIFAYACMRDLVTRAPDVRFVILVPTVALQDQWAVGLTVLSAGQELLVGEVGHWSARGGKGPLGAAEHTPATAAR